ncbi:hypothetical protein ACA910_021378 [Epithemia clementina (nom. ined.)]
MSGSYNNNCRGGSSNEYDGGDSWGSRLKFWGMMMDRGGDEALDRMEKRKNGGSAVSAMNGSSSSWWQAPQEPAPRVASSYFYTSGGGALAVGSGGISSAAAAATASRSAERVCSAAASKASHHYNNLPRGSGLILAMRDISGSIREFWESGDWKVWLQWFFWNVLVHLLVVIVVMGLAVYLGQKIYRWMVPYTAAELHHQGLHALQSTNRNRFSSSSFVGNSSKDNTNSKNKQQQQLSNKKSHQQQQRSLVMQQREKERAEKYAETKWKQALQRDPTYGPAMVSLAAMYLYRQDEPKKALELIRSPSVRRIQKQESKRNLQAIQADAQALQQGHKSMIQSELAETEYLTVLAALSRDNTKYDNSRKEQ